MKKNIRQFSRLDRDFEIKITPTGGFHGTMADVSVREVVRPNWKFFRTREIFHSSFWVYDCPDLEVAAKRMLDFALEKEEDEKALYKKWSDWEEVGK